MTRRKVDWLKIVKANIDALPEKKGDQISNVAMSAQAHAFVVRAAARRGISTSSYIKRAAYAMAAQDLELPLSEILQRDPRATAVSGVPFVDGEGKRFGEFEIATMVQREEPA